MNRKPYSSAIKKTPYKYPIAKNIAGRILNGDDRTQINEACVETDGIGVASADRRREITNVLYERLMALDNYLLDQFYNGDVATSKFILVYAIAKTDSLFFDFLFEVYREALNGERHYLAIDDFENFFAVKKEADPIVSGWSDETLRCMTKGYRNILSESGLGTRVRRTIEVSRVMIHPDVEEHIREAGDGDYLRAMLGGD